MARNLISEYIAAHPENTVWTPETGWVKDHHAGELAYLDTFSGLVPCKVLSVQENDSDLVKRTVIMVRLTAGRGAYRKGEVLDGRQMTVVPRSSVRTVCGQYRIRNNYRWV